MNIRLDIGDQWRIKCALYGTTFLLTEQYMTSNQSLENGLHILSLLKEGPEQEQSEIVR